MMLRSVSLAAGVVVERVGGGLMVIVPGDSNVVSLTGRPAEVLSNVEASRKADLADPAVRDLVELGIVTAPGLSRRGLIKAGAISAGAGIAVLAVPGAAAASSSSRGDDGALPLFPVMSGGAQLSYPSGGLSTTPQLSGTIYMWRGAVDNLPAGPPDPGLYNFSSVVVDSVVRTSEWAVNGFFRDIAGQSGYTFGSNVQASGVNRVEMDFAYGELEYYFLYTTP
jgi:hypothetical protein